MREARSAISKGPQHFQDAVAAYSTVIDLRTGNISSQEFSSNPFDGLVEDLDNMTINTTVEKADNPFDDFGPSTYNTRTDYDPFAEFGPSTYNTRTNYDPFAEFGPKIEVVNDDEEDYEEVDFGRKRKEKRKVSKKKVSKKKGPSPALKKLCKRLKVKLTTKRGGKKSL